MDATSYPAIDVWGDYDVHLEAQYLSFKGLYGYRGYHGSTYQNCNLYLDGADAVEHKFQGTSGAIDRASHLYLKDIDFSSEDATNCHTGCYFDEQSHSVRVNGGKVASGKVVNSKYNGGALTIDNANLRCNQLSGFTDLVLLGGSTIVEPWGGRYDTARKCVVDAQGRVADHVFIADAETTTGISVSPATEPSEVIYDISGRRQDEKVRGINIVRQSDSTVRKLIVR